MAKKEATIIKGYIPHGIHQKKGLVYFSSTRQKWVKDIGKLKIGDILSSGTVPIVNPQKTLKNIVDVIVDRENKKEVNVGVITITIEL